ncbi:hypothetical protein WA171_001411 [Blastocystis sp. BT1]
MQSSIFAKRQATLPAQTPDWVFSPPSVVSIDFVDLQIYGVILLCGEWILTFVWLGIVLNMFPHMRFKRISLSCRISLCLVSVCFELLKCSYSMYGTIFYYHSIVCSLTNIIASAFALLFNLGPLSVLRANNRKNLMPTIPDLSEGTFNYIMSVTSFEKNRAVIHISFIRYRLKIGRKAFNSLMLKQYKVSLQLYLSLIAQHLEDGNLVARMMIVIDDYGFIRNFIPRIPSSLFVLGYRKKADKNLTLFEFVSVENRGDSHVRYYYADLGCLGYKLNDMQKKSIAWLLSEMNECVVVQLRTFRVQNFILAGLSENVRMATLHNSYRRPRRWAL